MIQKKICLLGGFGVGKTSLISRYVHSMFSDKYLTTVGVKIDKKSVTIDGTEVDLVIWDIYGQDDYQKVRMSYLRGIVGQELALEGLDRFLGTLFIADHAFEAVQQEHLHLRIDVDVFEAAGIRVVEQGLQHQAGAAAQSGAGMGGMY